MWLTKVFMQFLIVFCFFFIKSLWNFLESADPSNSSFENSFMPMVSYSSSFLAIKNPSSGLSLITNSIMPPYFFNFVKSRLTLDGGAC